MEHRKLAASGTKSEWISSRRSLSCLLPGALKYYLGMQCVAVSVLRVIHLAMALMKYLRHTRVLYDRYPPLLESIKVDIDCQNSRHHHKSPLLCSLAVCCMSGWGRDPLPLPSLQRPVEAEKRSPVDGVLWHFERHPGPRPFNPTTKDCNVSRFLVA